MHTYTYIGPEFFFIMNFTDFQITFFGHGFQIGLLDNTKVNFQAWVHMLNTILVTNQPSIIV